MNSSDPSFGTPVSPAHRRRTERRTASAPPPDDHTWRILTRQGFLLATRSTLEIPKRTEAARRNSFVNQAICSPTPSSPGRTERLTASAPPPRVPYKVAIRDGLGVSGIVSERSRSAPPEFASTCAPDIPETNARSFAVTRTRNRVTVSIPPS
jgi:hypothetical protein